VLSAENRDAWQLYGRVVSQFTVDGQCVGSVLQRLTASLDEETFGELYDRLAIVHQVLHPPRKAGKSEDS
jgi:hypothetical protein